MRDIKLYYKPGSCASIPHALLLHLGLPFTPVQMKNDPANRKFYIPADGSMTHAEYKQKVHPDGYVPALVVDGTVITEMPAIMFCIVSLADPKFASLLGNPEDPIERAQVQEWLFWLSNTVHTLGMVAQWRPYRAAGEDPAAQEAVRKRGSEVVKEAFARIDARYKGREWAIGEAVTLVDIHLHLFRDWAGDDGLGLPMAKDYPEYDRVMRKVEGLEGMVKMMKAEGQKPIYS
jgi:glutathione S-transferase